MYDENGSAVHPTGQEGESTQQDVTQSEQSTDTGESEVLTPEQQAEKDEASNKAKDPNGWAVKRIGDLTRQRHEAERKAEHNANEAARYRAIAEAVQGDNAPADRQGQQPQLDINALVEQRAALIANEQAAQVRGASVAKTGAESFPDFQQAVQTLDALGISNDQVQSLLGMDDAHKVIYHLGKNPEEAARILAMPPIQQGRELERLALKSAQPAAKAVSNAPSPITPVDGASPGGKDPSKMSTAEWMAWRNKNANTRF